MMDTLNLWAAWIGTLLGMFSGAAQGLFFHRADWLDGYGSWRRRLTRLGHISFFGLAFVNLAFFFTVDHLMSAEAGALPGAVEASSRLLVAGGVLMPIVCHRSAWRKERFKTQHYRHRQRYRRQAATANGRQLPMRLPVLP